MPPGVRLPRRSLPPGGGAAPPGARLAVHSVAAGWIWYSIDATVTPPSLGDGPFRAWEPGELMIVSHDADTSPEAPTDDGMATVRSVEVLEGDFAPDEGMKYSGEKRLRFTVACDPSLRVAKLRYYFEGFGRIELPPA